MSRTIRHLPTAYNYSLKQYKGHVETSLRVLPRRNFIWIDIGTGVDPKDLKYYLFCTSVENFEKKYAGSKYLYVKEGFWWKNSEEEVAARLKDEIIYWSRKNKTCRRQRKNGVRYSKKARHGEERAESKRIIIKEVNDYYMQEA
jgi:hypothetical protein